MEIELNNKIKNTIKNTIKDTILSFKNWQLLCEKQKIIDSNKTKFVFIVINHNRYLDVSVSIKMEFIVNDKLRSLLIVMPKVLDEYRKGYQQYLYIPRNDEGLNELKKNIKIYMDDEIKEWDEIEEAERIGEE